MVANREPAKVVGLYSITMGLQKAMLPVVSYADLCLVAVTVTINKAGTSRTDCRDRFRFSEVFLNVRNAVRAADTCNAPVWSKLFTV